MTLTDAPIFLPLLAAAFVLLIAPPTWRISCWPARRIDRARSRSAWRSAPRGGGSCGGLLIESLLLALVAWVLAVGFSWLA